MELEQLIPLAQAGDEDARGALYQHSYQRTYYLALKISGNPEDAEDATQDAFISAFGALHTLKNPKAFDGWLARIVSNRCKTKQMRGHETYALPEDYDSAIPDPKENLIPDAYVQDVEKRRLIVGMIDDLAPEQREAVMLFYYAQIPVSQIALDLGCSQNTVKSRLYYARQKLKENILAMEQRDDIRLHSFGPMGLLFAADAISIGSAMPAVGLGTAGTIATAATATTVKETTKVGILATLKAKVIALCTAGAVVAGGGVVIATLPEKVEVEVEEEVAPIIEPVEFENEALEHNVRLVLDKPTEDIYEEDLEGFSTVYLFEDGMAVYGNVPNSTSGEVLAGTVPLTDLTDFDLLPVRSLHVMDCGEVLETLPTMEDVELLSISNDSIQSWGDLFLKLPNVTILHSYVEEDGHGDFDAVAMSKSLECLYIYDGEFQLDMTEMDSLKAIYVAALGTVSLSATAPVETLETLVIGYSANVILDVGDCAPNLENLDIATMFPMDTSDFAYLYNLRWVSFTGEISTTPVDLTHCEALEYYYTNGVTEIIAPDTAMFSAINDAGQTVEDYFFDTYL